MNEDEKFMQVAIKEAKKAQKNDEVPIGAVIVKEGKIIAKAYNRRNKSKIATHHAEILAIERACKQIGDWRLEGCTIYVTLEPCPMCAGAIMNARLSKVVYGAKDLSSEENTFMQIVSDTKRLNHKVDVVEGVLKEDCAHVLSTFFKQKRINQ
ncbi:MAG: tRNA adenosine(34) deaminase TadA [Clostridia bacterium]|nr:tRNA adenosine(34) deaminase TadA [Clostridia bacterium]